MQFKIALITAALATLVAAGSKCSTGPIQCCQQTQDVGQALGNSHTRGLLSGAGLLTVLLGGVTGQVGTTCSPVELVGGSTCSSQAVCCENNAKGGLVSIGCVPVQL